MADPKVVHPAPQDRIDSLNHFPYGLADLAAEDLPELRDQRFPLLLLGRIVRSPHSLTAPNATKLESQKGKALSFFRSTIRLLSSLISTRSFASSSRSRLSTPL